jgi:hypothetical protein
MTPHSVIQIWGWEIVYHRDPGDHLCATSGLVGPGVPGWSFCFCAVIGKKGASCMVSSSPVPWFNRPAREFPAQVWLAQRYGFTVPPFTFGVSLPQQAGRPAGAGTSQRRPFPALVWLATQATHRERDEAPTSGWPTSPLTPVDSVDSVDSVNASEVHGFDDAVQRRQASC